MAFDASAATQDFVLEQGDDETFAITYNDENGDVKDISGWTFWLTIKSNVSDTDAGAVIQKTVTSHTDAANGRTDITITNSDTGGLNGNYYYDVQRKDSAGNIKTVMQGRITFVDDVTESTT